jgi:excinuclease ABC subunit A
MAKRVSRRERAGVSSPDPDHAIRVRGARVHNLRDVDIDIPRDRFVVLTGVSGSGKSSLAFDTLYAEGQRRYIESLSTYARHFLDQLERPDVDLIDGLPPTVSIDQRSGSANPRSTVATITEIYDYLRLLYARAGVPHCPQCGDAIRRQMPEQMVAGVLAMQEGRKVLVLAPLVRGRKGQHIDTFRAIRRAGLLRARVDGQMVEIRDDPKLARTKTHDIEAVIDRLVVREGIRPRLAESIDLALKLGEGTVILSAQTESGWEDRILSVRFACPRCGVGFEELEPRTFSFNSPYGACPTCDGLGTLSAFEADLVIPDRSKSLAQEGVAPWQAVGARLRERLAGDPSLADWLKRHGLTRTAKLASWPSKRLKQFLEGEPEAGFEGLLAALEQAYLTAATERQRAVLAAYRGEAICPDCAGARLRPEARAVTLAGRPIQEVTSLPVTVATRFFAELTFEPPLDAVGPPLVREIETRLGFLDHVGLGYLTLARPADTLSGGELQRVRLASQIGSGLVGVGYLLDEPTTGLHQRDTARLLASLANLRDLGNSVLVVEHDEATIRAADWVIDLGPGAGPDGGQVVATGPPGALHVTGDSPTARYLNHEIAIAIDRRDRLEHSPGSITVVGASEHNLKTINVRFPLGTFTAVTGVSGSGKSTLVLDVLARAVRRQLEGVGPRPGAHKKVEGLAAIAKQIVIDQAPIGRTPRSTPGTYTGVFDEIRKVFALTRDAKVRGYKASRFSFNVKGGRCEACQGQGLKRIEMNFLPDLFVRCESCGGKRFNRQTLEVRYKGLSIGDVLDLRVDAAREVFDPVPRVKQLLDALHEVGLGYVTLGQSSTTLSGGEAQRVKLAAELGRLETGKTLYILDEPTTGLHFADVANLLRVLHRLADLGNTIVVIEHNLDVIKTADWVVDLGPEGGDSGGDVVAMGPPQAISKVEASYTGQYLRGLLPPGKAGECFV